MSLSAPERLLKSLGIEKPEDIDLEGVAWSLGAKVKYRPLKSCEARICGYENKAIISVDDSRMPQRQRFSLAHEIGHWIYHRGQLLICRAGDIGSFGGFRKGATSPEFIADQFASELILTSLRSDAGLEAISLTEPEDGQRHLDRVQGKQDGDRHTAGPEQPLSRHVGLPWARRATLVPSASVRPTPRRRLCRKHPQAFRS
jgi:hypothetical protein